ncbi:MAG: glycosyltransferase family 2 protein [Bdellovibrionaceae bacterium]|jgi:GT2 family glycosyltransferase|nr:glycosyltransferase family 2 protein [Pseudobdellovibrionaceae bacterium]
MIKRKVINLLNKYRTKILIICINYCNEKDLFNYLNSLAKCTLNNNIEVYVVDNSEEKKLDELHLKKIFTNTTLVSADENLGYFGGANCGFNKFKSNNDYVPQWVIVSNTDLEFKNSNFFNDLNKYCDLNKLGVIAPSIISGITKSDQNPHLLKRPSHIKMILLKMLFTNYIIFSLYHALYDFKRILKKTILELIKVFKLNDNSPDIKQIYAAHGSFLIIHKNYFLKGGNLNYHSFLYGEEFFLAENIKKINLSIYYVPILQIHHREHATTGRIPSKKIHNFILNSYKMNNKAFFPFLNFFKKGDLK